MTKPRHEVAPRRRAPVQTTDAPAEEARRAPRGIDDDLFGQGQDGDRLRTVGRIELRANVGESRGNLVGDQEQGRHLKPAGDVHRDGRALIVLSVWSENEQQDVAQRDGQQGLLIEAGVSIDKQEVEVQISCQLAHPLTQGLHVISIPQDSSDVSRLHTGGDEMQGPAGRHRRRHGYPVGDVVSNVPDGARAPQIVVERAIHILVEAEEDVDARTLNIAVDDTDTVAQCSKIGGDVGRRVALAGAPAEGVDRHNRCHSRIVVETPAMSAPLSAHHVSITEYPPTRADPRRPGA